MALKQPFMVKTVLGSEDLSLKALVGEAILVKNVYIANSATNYVTFKTDRNTVGYFRVGGALGSHLPFPYGKINHAHDWKTGATTPADVTTFATLLNPGASEVKAAGMIGSLVDSKEYYKVGELAKGPQIQGTLLSLLESIGVFGGYPVPEGSEFTITGAAGTGAVQIVIYQLWEPDDITGEMENGPTATDFLYINYGDYGADIPGKRDWLLGNSVSPPEFPSFPFGVDVPAKKLIDVIGILASDICIGEEVINSESPPTAARIYTQYLKIIRERRTLFDVTLNGIPLLAKEQGNLGSVDTIGEGYSLVGNYSTVDGRPPLILPEPLYMGGGEELNVFLTTEETGTPPVLPVDKHQVAFIEKVHAAEKAPVPLPVAPFMVVPGSPWVRIAKAA